MAQEVKSKSHQKGSRLKEENGDAILWKRHGLEDVYFQREAQVNFWTIMGGLAVAALLTQFSNLLEGLQASRWQLLLYFIASILILVNSWVQTTWGTLVLKWPISIPLTLVMVLSYLSNAIQCLMISNPAGWMFASGSLILFILLHQLLMLRIKAWAAFSPDRVRKLKSGLWIYFFWMLMAFAGGVHLYYNPTALVESIWGSLALLSSIAALVMQHLVMEGEKKELGIA